MAFILNHLLQEGMVLSRDVYVSMGLKPLFLSGTVIDADVISKMNQLKVPGVFTDDSISQKMISGEIEEEFNTEIAVNKLKQVYNNSVSIGENATQIGILADNIIESVTKNKNLVFNMADIKNYDRCTYRHCLRVGLICSYMGAVMKLDMTQLKELTLSALLHDIGKSQIPKEILNKPGKFTVDESEIMTTHPLKGYNMLLGTNYSEEILEGVLYHHEKWDGSGYPEGLKGKEIPLYARIIAVADIYDALTSKRPYRDPCSPAEVCDYLEECKNQGLDGTLVDIFKDCLHAENNIVPAVTGSRMCSGIPLSGVYSKVPRIS